MLERLIAELETEAQNDRAATDRYISDLCLDDLDRRDIIFSREDNIWTVSSLFR